MPAETDLKGDRRAEAFAAWRRFLEAIAVRYPLVLTFEDLHWADDALLDFIEHLQAWATSRILVLATARAELLDRRPGWARAPNSTLIRVGPLEVDASVEWPSLVVEVRDRGDGISPRASSPGLGLGLPLIASLADTVQLGRDEAGHTEVRMGFSLRRLGGASSGGQE